VQPYSRLGLTG